ncbi:hypothetical protein LNP25_29690 [Klebsiella variicola subsp. variicola]|nr:hypothetical protein [Klebsiella variicola subsp. variicola]
MKSYRHCDVDAGDKRREVKQSLQRRLFVIYALWKYDEQGAINTIFLALMPRQNAE